MSFWLKNWIQRIVFDTTDNTDCPEQIEYTIKNEKL